MAYMSLSLLGPFAAAVNRQPLGKFRTQKVQALLIYLAVEGTGRAAAATHPREGLMALLWPDLPRESAQSNLRQTLFHLRHMLPDVVSSGESVPFLQANRQKVWLNPALPCELDLVTLAGLLSQTKEHAHPTGKIYSCDSCRDCLQQAAELYRGDFLADFYLPDSEPFEEWVGQWRERLRRQTLKALETLANIYTNQRRYGEAQATARRQLEIDNLRENGHRQLMAALFLAGERSAAIEQYHTCRRLLQAELAISPAAETDDLFEAIRGGIGNRG